MISLPQVKAFARGLSIPFKVLRKIANVYHEIHKKTGRPIVFSYGFPVFYLQISLVYQLSSFLAARYRRKFPVSILAFVRSLIRSLQSLHIYVWMGRLRSLLAINVSSSMDSILSQMTHFTLMITPQSISSFLSISFLSGLVDRPRVF